MVIGGRMASQGGNQYGGWQPPPGDSSGAPVAGPEYTLDGSAYPPGGYSFPPGDVPPGSYPAAGEYPPQGNYPPGSYPPAADYQSQGNYPQQGSYPPAGEYPPADAGWSQSAPPMSGPPMSGPPMSAQPYASQSAPPYQQEYQQYGPGMPPGQPYGQPGPQFMPGAPGPQGPRSSSTPLVLWLVAGGLALILACGGVFYFGYKAADDETNGLTTVSSGDATPTAQQTTATPTPSPRPSTRPLVSLDLASTDTTPFVMTQFFPTDTFESTGGETFTRAGAGQYDACEKAGDTKVTALFKANGCGNMQVGVYLNEAQDIMIGVLVVPLPAASNATAVVKAIDADVNLRSDFAIWCPKSPNPGSSVCDATIPSGTYVYLNYLAFHRYALITVELYTDARTKAVSTTLSADGQACINEVADSIPKVY